MRHILPLSALAGLALMSGTAVAADNSAIVGTYGDAQGRLGCAADGEHLEFTADGRVVLQEHADDAGQTVATYAVFDPVTVDVVLTQPPGHVVRLSVLGTHLQIVGYTVDGIADPEALAAWSNRHDTFLPCAELDG